MSFPNFPNITPEIRLDLNDAINLLLASIAFEELGLAHVINVEAEIIQFALEALKRQQDSGTPAEELLRLTQSINQRANTTMKNIIKKEMLLKFILEDTILLIETEEDDDDEG